MVGAAARGIVALCVALLAIGLLGVIRDDDRVAARQHPHQQHHQQNQRPGGAARAYATVEANGQRRYTARRRLQLRDHVVEMFRHGYGSYMTYAYPQDELQPVTCTGTNVFGGYSMTLIDSLDMLALVGDDVEFFKRVREVGSNVRFDADLKVSVFETTIRVVGGLLSAHLLAEKHGPRLRATSDRPDREEAFAYDGSLLPLAVQIADKLMPAFNTPTAIPFNEIHLRAGVNKADGHTSCPAAAGSLLLEFGLLTQLTGDCKYLNAARRAFLSLWRLRAAHQVVGTMIDIFSGSWINPQTNIGASVDSFFEYMFKAYIAFDDDEYFQMWLDAYKGIQKYTYYGGWYLTGSIEHNLGPISEKNEQQINALQAFWPGLQAISGETHQALDAYEKMLCIVRANIFMPEYLHLGAFLDKGPDRKTGPGYPLRPEFLESTYFLQRSTGDDIFFAIAEDFMWSLEKARTRCGYAAILDVFTMKLENKMDSFMLSETLKYLYFIFTPTDDELIKDGLIDKATRAPPPGATGHFASTSLRHHPLWFDLEMGHVVNTEAHPVPINTDTFATHRKCTTADPEFMPLHARVFMPESGRHFGPAKEDFGDPTPFESKRMCPVVDYWRDVAPFIHSVLEEHQQVCYNRAFSTRPLRNTDSNYAPAKGKGRPSKVIDPPSQQQQAEQEATRTVPLTLPNPTPFDPMPQQSEIAMALFQPASSPEIHVTERHGVVSLSPSVPMKVFHIAESPATVTFGRPSMSYAAAAKPPRPGLPVWGALFGSSMKDFCNPNNPNGDDFGGVSDLDRPEFDSEEEREAVPFNLPEEFSPVSLGDGFVALHMAAMAARKRTFHVLTASWNLCPRRDGTFPRMDQDLRAHVDEAIDLNVWLANLTDAHGRPDAARAPIALMVHRGGCTFKEKAHVAQALGAAAVLMMSDGEQGFSMSDAELPFETTIRVPVLLLRKADALILQRESDFASKSRLGAAPPTVQIRCTNSAAEQLYMFGLVPFYTRLTNALAFVPKALALPTATRSIGVHHLFEWPPLATAYYGGTGAGNRTLAAAVLTGDAAPSTISPGLASTPAFRSRLAAALSVRRDGRAEALERLADAACRNCYIDLGVAGTGGDSPSVAATRHRSGGGDMATAAREAGLSLHSFFTATAADVGTLELRLFIDHQRRPVNTVLTAAAAPSGANHMQLQRLHAQWVFQNAAPASSWKAVMLRQFRLREGVVGAAQGKIRHEHVEDLLAQLHAWATTEGADRAKIIARYVMSKSASTWVEVVAFSDAEAPRRFADLAQWHTHADAHDGHVLNAAMDFAVHFGEPMYFTSMGKFWMQEL